MLPSEPSPELLAVAKRMVWFKPPEETLRDASLFLGYLMIYGTIEDLRVAMEHYGEDAFRTALAEANPGLFDPRSWTYWHLRLGLGQPPPLPVRHFAE